MDEQKTSDDAAQKRQRRAEMIRRIMVDYRGRQNVNGLRLYTDANFHLNKPDRFNGETEFLALMDELVTEGEISVRKSTGDRAENKWFTYPLDGSPESAVTARARAVSTRVIGGKF